VSLFPSWLSAPHWSSESNNCTALIRVAEPIALTSIFPYAWKLVLHYEIGDPHDAAFWAGILIAAFSLAEALTGMFWGSLSDRIGRKKVVILGSSGTVLSLLIVGFAPNFWIALLGRIVGGLLNGNMGVIQVSVRMHIFSSITNIDLRQWLENWLRIQSMSVSGSRLRRHFAYLDMALT
jgi:MFS family permease